MKCNPVSFKGLAVFLQPFVNWAASHVVNSRSSEELYKMQDLSAEGSYRRKDLIICGKVTFAGDGWLIDLPGSPGRPRVTA